MLGLEFDIKFLYASMAAALMVVSYIPYFRDMVAGRTKPHTYTWLIWLITQGTAIAALLHGGGGGFAAAALIIAEALVFTVFVASFSYGTKNITRFDTLVFLLALLSIFVWWQLDSPLYAVLLVTAIDVFGYIPTVRKCYGEPWSESLPAWSLYNVSNFFTLLALNEYNMLTVPYITAMLFANASIVVICLMRRSIIPRPPSVEATLHRGI